MATAGFGNLYSIQSESVEKLWHGTSGNVTLVHQLRSHIDRDQIRGDDRLFAEHELPMVNTEFSPVCIANRLSPHETTIFADVRRHPPSRNTITLTSSSHWTTYLMNRAVTSRNLTAVDLGITISKTQNTVILRVQFHHSRGISSALASPKSVLPSKTRCRCSLKRYPLPIW